MTVLPDAPPPVVGGRYSIGELIGRGGAAEVFRARDELLGRDVAIKMFTTGGEVPTELPDGGSRPGPLSSTAAVDAAGLAESAPGSAAAVGDLENGQEARHRREVLTLAGLSHPGLVTVYDVGDQAGRAYFVMQLIEGDTLGQRIRFGPMDVADVVALGAALADALAYVHRRGVVHRDVKPGNVLLDGEGRAHLSDFGIAAVRDAAPVTEAGMVIGTASYLSPEQVRGEAIGPPVDVYALGLVLLESLTGRREYPGAALEAAVARLHRRPAVPPGLPPSLAALLTAMTEDDPAARPSAEEVVVGMREVSREVGVDAETVLSPVLMSAPTSAVGRPGALAVGAAARAAAGGPAGSGTAGGVMAGGVTAGGVTAGGVTAGARTGGAPRRRGLLLAVGMLIAVLAAGTAVAATLIAASPAAPAPSTPVATAPALPPALPAPELSTTTEAERATATRTRPRRTTTVAPPVVTTPRRATVPPVVPAVPAPVEVTTTPPTTAAPTTTASPGLLLF